MKTYISVSNHVEDLASGQMVGIGEEVQLSAADEREPHNVRLIEDGVLIPVTRARQAQVEKAADEDAETSTEGEGE